MEPSHRRSDLELIELHARTLFTHDPAGHLVAINEQRARPAARFFLGRTARGVIWRVRHDLPLALRTHLGELVAAEPVTDDLERPPACLPTVRAALQEHAPIIDDEAGPAYCFPDAIDERSEAMGGGDPTGIAGGAGGKAPRGIGGGDGAVAVTIENAHLLQRWLPEWLPDVSSWLPLMTVLVDGAAVSICACARIPGEATEAGLETHPVFRGRGHAATVTAAWARAMRDRGVVPLYSTSWTNRSSQRVAAKLGLHRYGASMSIY
jgi:hypothetical protein